MPSGAARSFDAEGLEHVPPEAIQVFAQRHEPAGCEAVEVAGAFALLFHEARVPQDLEVLRHGGPAHAEALRHFSDRQGAWPEPLHHRAARGVGEGPEGMSVSSH